MSEISAQAVEKLASAHFKVLTINARLHMGFEKLLEEITEIPYSHMRMAEA